MPRRIQEYGQPTLTQKFTIEVRNCNGNPMLESRDVEFLLHRHRSPLLSLSVVDTTEYPKPPFNPQAGDIVRGRGSGRLFRVIARDGDMLWLKTTDRPDGDRLVRGIRDMDMGPTDQQEFPF